MENLNEILSIADVQTGKSYSMDSGDAKLTKVNATASDSIKFITITPKDADGNPDPTRPPFARMNGCYTSLFFTFDESDGRGGHQEKFFFDMDYDNLIKCVAKIKHIFENTDSSGDGSVNLIADISLAFGITPLTYQDNPNKQVVVDDYTQLQQVYEMENGTPILFKRIGEPIDTGKMKGNKAITYQKKALYTFDVEKLRNAIQAIADASQEIVGTEYYLDFDKSGKCSIMSA